MYYKTDVLIIGAGPVGLFAIFEAGMLGMKAHIVDSLEAIGGQCSALYPEKPIYDIPAWPEISAADLISNLSKQASKFMPQFHLNQQVTQIKDHEKSFIATTSLGTEIEAKIILIAAGAGAFGPNRPPLQNIKDFEGKSIFYMVKNKADFTGKKITIAGGGDSAIDWAINLANISEKIYLVHRRDKFRAAPESLKQVKNLVEQGKIEMVVPYQLSGLIGNNGILSKVIVEDLDGNKRELESDILLPFFGLAMELGPIRDWGLALDHNHIKIEQSSCETSIPGIYAIGDVASYNGKIKLILTGFAEAATALHHAYSRVFDGKALHFEYSTTKGVPTGSK